MPAFRLASESLKTVSLLSVYDCSPEYLRPMSPAIELIAINKRFGDVHANQDVNSRVERGTIHGIVGENGAGKSTLMSILYGFYEADSGEIRVNGKPLASARPPTPSAPASAWSTSTSCWSRPLTVVENVMLGAEGGALLRAGEAKVRAELARLAADYGLEIDVDAIVGDLSVGLQQRVEILKALYRGADILILDEPTAVLTPPEADALFASAAGAARSRARPSSSSPTSCARSWR